MYLNATVFFFSYFIFPIIFFIKHYDENDIHLPVSLSLSFFSLHLSFPLFYPLSLSLSHSLCVTLSLFLSFPVLFDLTSTVLLITPDKVVSSDKTTTYLSLSGSNILLSSHPTDDRHPPCPATHDSQLSQTVDSTLILLCSIVDSTSQAALSSSRPVVLVTSQGETCKVQNK